MCPTTKLYRPTQVILLVLSIRPSIYAVPVTPQPHRYPLLLLSSILFPLSIHPKSPCPHPCPLQLPLDLLLLPLFPLPHQLGLPILRTRSRVVVRQDLDE